MHRIGPIILLALLWGVAALDGAWQPSANFPLNDDWQYAHVAKQWAETGIFRVDVPVAPTLVLQSALGAAVTKVAGFSFSHLRVLTLAIGSILVLLLWGLHRIGNASVLWGTLTLLVLVTNPIWLHLTQSFMTEIYGAAIGFFGVSLWYRSGASTPRRMLAAVVMGSSFWVRQFAVLVFPAVCLAELFTEALQSGRDEALRRAWQRRWHWILAGLAFVLPIILYFPWAKATGNYNKAFSTPFSKIFRPAVGHFVVQFPIFIFYMTAFFLPILAAKVAAAKGYLANPGSIQGRIRTWSLRMVGFMGLIAVLAWYLGDDPYVIKNTLHRVFPFLGNVMTGYGLGPITFANVWFNPSSVLPAWSILPWLFLEAGLVVLSGAWIPVFFLPLRNMPQKSREIAIFGICLAGLTFLASVQAYLFAIFDRYHFQGFLGLCVSLPLLLGSLVQVDDASVRRRIALAFGIPWVLWSSGWIAAQHDYLAWNQSRWSLAERAKRAGISMRELDGGYELSGWLAFEEGKPNAGDPDCGVRQLWFCAGRRYQMGLNVFEDRREVFREPVRSWLRNFPDLLLTKQVESGH